MFIIVEIGEAKLDMYMTELHALGLYAFKGDFHVQYEVLWNWKLK